MKKNKMLRIASILLVVTLLSTCVISGTFAKYVTKAEGSDSARVAKWGVIAELNAGDAFAKQYKTTDTDTYPAEYGEYTVDATEKVVAPGTKSADLDSNITAHVSGTPEVATKYEIKIENIQDIVLPAGDYKDYTELKKQDDGTYIYENYTVADDYAPILWTLKVGGVALATNKSMTEIMERADEIAAHIERLNLEGMHLKAEVVNNSIIIDAIADPNVPIDLGFELTRQWKFESGHDKEDTLLGNIIAGVTDYTANTTISADVSVSATQID